MMIKLKAYFELTKPRALVVIVFTTCLGFLIAETRSIHWLSFAYLALGTAVAAAGSLALNQHLERKRDALMERTKFRPIPSGRITSKQALIFGWLLMLSGYGALWLLVNPSCSVATMLCGFSYLYLYTPLKYTTSLSSFVGAIPGALLPIMGWIGSQGRMELGAWLLFTILFLWQIPHALIIAIRYREDYARAGMRQLPVIASNFAAARQMLVHVVILVPTSLMPTLFRLTGWTYSIAAAVLGIWLLVGAIAYLLHENDRHARRFFVSLSAYLPLLMIAMFVDTWLTYSP